MSDSQTPLLVAEQRQRAELLACQQQAQQRQILAMMGIGQWVTPDSPTLKISAIADSEAQLQAIALPTEQQPAVEAPVRLRDSQVNHQLDSASTIAPVAIDSDIDNRLNNIDNIVASNDSATSTNKSYNFNDLNSFTESETSPLANNTDESANLETNHSNSTDLETTSSEANNLEAISFEKVAPFDLQGGRYGNWVLIVDIQALNNDSQKLWQNITQALSIDCETSSFPICEGMDTAELANASLAGYLFKICQSEDIKIAVLTALPDGLTHPNFTESPSLEAMLANSSLKRQLWQQLSS